MCLMIMKRSIPEAFRGSIIESESAKKLLEEIEQYFAKNEKSEASNLLAKLVSIKYKDKGNIREYIMEMSHLASKLKSLKLELSDDLFVHLILISLPTHFGQFKNKKKKRAKDAVEGTSQQKKQKKQDKEFTC
ncbi:uncharacterized protein LOC111411491 [Olea europaea var. sylvestris]|uniref:uncharacterized protein LOC111411491 n=1 Tax=Olea europaea var. sylvestris TaxID=158386 RepID=UPI000C1CFAEC|nr:uncharacterized protein LOC111411491 [Olea europaea var. sylvestris]